MNITITVIQTTTNNFKIMINNAAMATAIATATNTAANTTAAMNINITATTTATPATKQ